MVLDALDASPYADNTVVALFSDHGFHLGEKQRWAKRSLWEDGTQVPLIIAGPGLKPGQRTKRPAELIDVYPTLLELAGLPTDDSQEGQSLVALLNEPDCRWNHPAITSFGKGNYSVRSTRYRYIRYYDGSEEFYDHQVDPHEWNNLLTSDSSSLKNVIAEHAQHVPRQEHEILPGKSTGHNAWQASLEAMRNN